jgi:hypothetical protein
VGIENELTWSVELAPDDDLSITASGDGQIL